MIDVLLWMGLAEGAERPPVVPAADERPTLEGDLGAFGVAVRAQLAHCREAGDEGLMGRTFIFGDRELSQREWCVATHERLFEILVEAQSWDDVWTGISEGFDRWESVGAGGRVMVTGYFAPRLVGSRVQTEEFSVPLYGRPADLVEAEVGGRRRWRRALSDGRLTRHFDRARVAAGALAGQGLELFWVRDPFEAFLFEVQGAGVIEEVLPDGGTARSFLNYAAQNGHPYVSLASVLQDWGVGDATVPGMRAFFEARPELVQRALNENPSVVYFEEQPQGPLGTMPLVLTPGHSAAFDLSLFPEGALVLLSSERPAEEGPGWLAFDRLVLVQDTGGAIRGAGRVDLFWGDDAYAERAAGLMRSEGRFGVLVPRER